VEVLVGLLILSTMFSIFKSTGMSCCNNKATFTSLNLNKNESNPSVSEGQDANELYLKRKSTLTSESKDLLQRLNMLKKDMQKNITSEATSSKGSVAVESVPTIQEGVEAKGREHVSN